MDLIDPLTGQPRPEDAAKQIQRQYRSIAGLDPDLPLPEAADKLIERTLDSAHSFQLMQSQIELPDARFDARAGAVYPQPLPTNVPEPVRYGLPPTKENPKTGSFLEGVVAGFTNDTLIGDLLRGSQTRAQVEAAMGPIAPEPGYSAFEDPKVKATPEMRANMHLYFDSQSRAETEVRWRQYQERQWDETSTAMAGPAYQAGRFAGAMIDPTLLVPGELGLGAKITRAMDAGGHMAIWGRLARGVDYGVTNAVTQLGLEATRVQNDPSYTAPGLADALEIAGGLGFAVGLLSRGAQHYTGAGDAQRAYGVPGQGHRTGLIMSAPDHPVMSDQAFMQTPGPDGVLRSAGAAATPYLAASSYATDLEREGLKSIFGLEKFGLNPAMRGLISSSLVVRQTIADMVDLMGLKQNKNVAAALTPAQKTAFPVEAEIAVRWKAKASTTESIVRGAWMEGRTSLVDEAAQGMGAFLKEQGRSWLSRDGRLGFTDFLDRAGKAVANGNVDLVQDAYTPFVEKAARAGDAHFKDLAKHATDLGMFEGAWAKDIQDTRMQLAALVKRGGDPAREAQLEARLAKMEELAKHGPAVNTGPNYFPRSWMQDRLVGREDEALAIFKQHFLQGGMSDAEATSAAAGVHAELTRSNFRPVIDEQNELIRHAPDPGSLKFRTFEIADDKVSDFLDWDLISAVRRQTATLAPAIELTRRYGDATMSGVLGDIQNEFEGLIGKARTGQERVALQAEMKQALDDVQALRDRLLNVAGASKDPHSWDERAIRLLKHYTSWTTLGLSAISQLGDLFRPLITEGLDATHRYGFMSLIDGSRAEIMKMANRERIVSGDANELATGATSLAFSNIGDTYNSRSAIERKANQFTGAYFMLNGMVHATELTKRWGAVIVQGNLNHEIMSWARAIREEMAGAEKRGAPGIELKPGQSVYPTGETPSSLSTASAASTAPASTVAKSDPAAASRIFEQDEGMTRLSPKDLSPGIVNGKAGFEESLVITPDGQLWHLNQKSYELARDQTEGVVGQHNILGLRHPDLQGQLVNLSTFHDEIGASVPTEGRTPQQTAMLRRIESTWKREGKGDKAQLGMSEENAHLPSGERARLAEEAKAAAAEKNPRDVSVVSAESDAALAKEMEGTPAGEHAAAASAAGQAPPSISKLMQERLLSLSLDANDVLAIDEMLRTHGVAFNSIHMANSEAWTDKEAQLLYRGAIGRALNRTVVTPGAADRPVWMTTSVGSLIGLYKTFGVSSMIRTLYAGLQDNDRTFWAGAAALTGAAIVLNEIRNQVFYDRSSFNQPYLGILADGVDRSGVLGSMMDVNNAIEMVTNNKIGVRPMVGAGKNAPASAQRFADTFFGPGVGKVVEGADVLGQVASGNATARTWNQMRGFVPGHRLPYVDPIADLMFPKPAPQRHKEPAP